MADNSAYAAAELASTLRDDPGEHVQEWAGLIDDPETVDLLLHLESSLNRPVLETQIGREIVGSAATQTIDESVREGNVSQMKSATGLTNQRDDEQKLPYETAERLANEGTIGLMWGSPGSGKTALSLDIARVWGALTGGTIIGNTAWDGYDELVLSDSDMLEAMATNKGPVLAVIDETAQDLSGFGEDMVPAQEFSNALTMVRKREGRHGQYAKRGSVLMVSHTKTKVAKAFRDLAMFAVEKPTNNDPGRAYLLDSESDTDDFELLMEVTGITDTPESYDEHEASEFTIYGVDEDEESDESESEDRPDRDEVARELQIKMAIETYAADPDASYRDVANSPGFDFSHKWVGDRIREFKGGEHRELWDGDAPEVGE